MAKGIFLLLVVIFVISCGSNNYSGQYEYLFKIKKPFYVDVNTGEETLHIDHLMEYMAAKNGEKRYKRIYKDVDTKMILNIEQNKTNIAGEMTISNDFNVVKFNIENGEIDQSGLLRLKMVKSDSSPTTSVSAGPFSLSLPISSRIQLNFDQQELMKDNKIKFKVGGVTRVAFFERNSNEDVIIFEKR